MASTRHGPFRPEQRAATIDGFAGRLRDQIGGPTLDFFDDGDSAAVCGWDGDVWLVTGLAKLGDTGTQGASHIPNKDPRKPVLAWQRIASGLFQPLGLKIVDGKIHETIPGGRTAEPAIAVGATAAQS